MIFKRSSMSSSFHWASSCTDYSADSFLSFLVLSYHWSLELLSDRPYWLLSFAPLHSFILEEVHSHMKNLSFEVWAMFVHTEEWILVDKQVIFFSNRGEQYYFANLGQLPIHFPLLTFSSLLPFFLMYLDGPSLVARSLRHSLQPSS